MTKRDQDHYPEILGQAFVLNANFVFTGIWAIIKYFLNENTQKKVQILGSDYEKNLLEVIDPDQLPKMYGGDC